MVGLYHVRIVTLVTISTGRFSLAEVAELGEYGTRTVSRSVDVAEVHKQESKRHYGHIDHM